MSATSGPFWGIHPRPFPWARYVVTVRTSDAVPAKMVMWTWTRWGAERERRRRQRRTAWVERNWVERGLAPLPGVRFDVLDLRDHPDNTSADDAALAKDRCPHLETVPVETDGTEVARLCLACDMQLPEKWQP